MIDTQALWEKIKYLPHVKQKLFHDSPARFKVPSCGRWFGKSRMAAAELLPDMLDLSLRGNRYWIVGPTYELGEKEFRYLWEDIIINLKMGHNIKRKAYNVRTGDMYIEMPWGTRVDVKSAQHPDTLVGEGLAGVIVSEAAKQSPTVWDKYITPALADQHGWAIFPSTPEGFNWFYDIYKWGQDPAYPDWESWNFPAWENPYVYPEGFDDPEIQRQLRTPDDPFFWQEIGASFRSFVGQIYTEWADEVHIVDKYQYNPEWPNYLFFDYGFENPFVALDAQISPSDEVYIWREYYDSGKIDSDHAAIMNARPQPEGYSIVCGFGDSADPKATATMSRLVAPTYSDPEAKKDWLTGIKKVKDFLAVQLNDLGEQKTHLYVDRNCDNTIFEFQNYRTKQLARTAIENKKEEPKKLNDHCMDAIRYGIMHLFELGARYHLSDVMESRDLGGPTSDEAIGREPDPVGIFSRGEGVFSRADDSAFRLDDIPRW
jgi:hypothetical protein